eukprot:6351318-Karenia_brevis.AAC.1
MKCRGCGSEAHPVANCPKGRGKGGPKRSFFEAQGAALQHHYTVPPPSTQIMSAPPVAPATLFADPSSAVMLGVGAHAQSSWFAIPSTTEARGPPQTQRDFMWTTDDQTHEDAAEGVSLSFACDLQDHILVPPDNANRFRDMSPTWGWIKD